MGAACRSSGRGPAPVDGSGEVELPTYRHFAERDALSDVVLERMLAGVSTRRYARTGEPVGDDNRGRRAVDEQIRGVA